MSEKANTTNVWNLSATFLGLYFWWVIPHEVLHIIGLVSQSILLAIAPRLSLENARNISMIDMNGTWIGPSNILEEQETPLEPFVLDEGGLRELLLACGSIALIVSIIQAFVPILFSIADASCYEGKIDMELQFMLEERARGFLYFYFAMHLLFVVTLIPCLFVPIFKLLFRHQEVFFFYAATLAEIIWNGGVVAGLIQHF